MDLDELRQELRAAADDGRVPHGERMAGVRRRVHRARAARVVPVALVLAAVAAVPVLRWADDRAPVVPAGYDGSYPGPETFDRLAVGGVCPQGGQPGTGTPVPEGPGEVTAGEAAVLGGALVAAVREAGAEVEVGLVERTATSLSPGAPPCGPSYSVYVSGDDGAVQLLLTLSWAGDDRFSGNLACPGGAPVEACADRSEEGWSGTVQAAPGGQLVVLARADGASQDGRGPTTPVVAVRQLQGDPIDADALVSVALAQDWHRLAEQVEAEVGP